MKNYRPKKIFIEKAVAALPHTQTILKRLAGIPSEIITNRHELFGQLSNLKDPLGEGKRHLLLAESAGPSIKPFREAAGYLSCDYYTIHLEEGCDLECSYCVLQAHLTNPFLMIYPDVEKIMAELRQFLAAHPQRRFRFGTAQLADALALDPITGFSEWLVPFFAEQKNAVLELKTKSDHVERLLKLNPKGNAIVSWSLNSERIQKTEEHRCAGLAERIAAAEKVLAAGSYRVGFHIDPVIDYEGWQAEYESMIEKWLTRIPEDKIAWISLGCFRSEPGLKAHMQTRFPKSKLPLAEWVNGIDGKMRYFKPKRIRIYQTLIRKLRKHFPNVTLYLSMELPEVWEQTFGGEHTPRSVCSLLDGAGFNEGYAKVGTHV